MMEPNTAVVNPRTTVTLRVLIQRPNAAKRALLTTALAAVREACAWFAEQMGDLQTTSRNSLHGTLYPEACRRFPQLPPATLQLAQAKAAAAVRSYEAQLRQGRNASPPRFPQPVPLSVRRDHHRLRQLDTGGWVLHVPALRGVPRVNLPLRTAPYHDQRLRELAEGRCTRGPVEIWVDARERWWAAFTLVYDTPQPASGACIGVDRGIVNIAVASTNTFFSGRALRWRLEQRARRRAGLQQAGRLARVKRGAGAERRWVRASMHLVSRRLVDRAAAEGQGLALERLTSIRERVDGSKAVRRMLHRRWAFAVLENMLDYKGKLRGVAVRYVDPRNTSRTCPACGSIAAGNRNGRWFRCLACGFQLDSDLAAARNIATRANSDSLSKRR